CCDVERQRLRLGGNDVELAAVTGDEMMALATALLHACARGTPVRRAALALQGLAGTAIRFEDAVNAGAVLRVHTEGTRGAVSRAGTAKAQVRALEGRGAPVPETH